MILCRRMTSSLCRAGAAAPATAPRPDHGFMATSRRRFNPLSRTTCGGAASPPGIERLELLEGEALVGVAELAGDDDLAGLGLAARQHLVARQARQHLGDALARAAAARGERPRPEGAHAVLVEQAEQQIVRRQQR